MFTFNFTTGGNPESFTPFTFASLVLVVVGILIYRFLKRDNKFIVMVFGEQVWEFFFVLFLIFCFVLFCFVVFFFLFLFLIFFFFFN